MFRLTLSQQLALIFASAMIVTQVVVLSLDRWFTNELEVNRKLAEARSVSANIAKMLPGLPEELRAATVRAFSVRGAQYFLLDEKPSAGPDGEVLPELAAQTFAWTERRDLRVREVFAGRYEFPFTGGFIRSVPGVVEDKMPRVFAAGDQKIHRMGDLVSEAPLWVPLSPPLGHPPIPGRLERAESIDYYPVVTIAMQLEDTGEWLTAYRFLRPPPNNGLITQLLFSGLAMLIIATVALFFGSRLMRPFTRLANSAEQLGRGEKGDVVTVSGPTDMQAVIAVFNRMNERITQMIDYQTGLLHSLGHDIKGPLTAADRLLKEVTPEGKRKQIQDRLSSVREMVEAIMKFSRAVMREGEAAPTDLSMMLETLVAEQHEVGAEVELIAPETLPISCRVDATSRAVRNLIENAVKYGHRARVQLLVTGDSAVVRVDDEGPGVPVYMLEEVLAPFKRLDADKSGSGLGLAIAQTIAVDQGGSLTLSNRREGGLRAEFRLPLSDHSVARRRMVG